VPRKLKDDIQQTRPFRSAGHQAVVGLMRTADHFRRSLSALLEPYGVTTQQYNVLRILRGAGAAGVPTLEIADRMIERAPGITRLLDRLEVKGWALRKRCPVDRRRVLCWITPTGLALLAELDDPVTQNNDASVAHLGEPETVRLIELLDRLRSGPADPASSDKTPPGSDTRPT